MFLFSFPQYIGRASLFQGESSLYTVSMGIIKKIVNDPWLSTIFIGLCVMLLLGGALFYIKSRNTEEPARELPAAGATENPPAMGGARVIDEEKFEGPVISYTDSGFVPSSIALTKEDAGSTECLIKFKNNSSGELLIRLGPPQETDNKGFPYDPVPSGGAVIIDPRYSHILKEEFYNRKNPAHRLAVELKDLCFQ